METYLFALFDRPDQVLSDATTNMFLIALMMRSQVGISTTATAPHLGIISSVVDRSSLFEKKSNMKLAYGVVNACYICKTFRFVGEHLNFIGILKSLLESIADVNCLFWMSH